MKIIWTFTLLMIPGVLSSISVTGYSGGGVSITCRYDEGYTDNVKYFCRGQNPVTPQIGWCSDLIKTKEKDKWVYSGRFSLYDDTRAAVFTVTFRDLREQDSGTYQCAVDRAIITDSYTEVKLNVLTDTDVPKTTSSLQPSSSAPPSSSSSSSSVFKTSTSNFTSEPPNMLKGLSLIISLVLVLLVLIIVAVVLLFLYKKHQSRGNDSSQTGAGKHEVVSHTGCDYENIKDTQKQLPTNPSVSPDCVYSTVQKATGDSNILITSAEDLNYAVVNFHKKADCPDRDRLRNNQDYSEYAAISHLTA
ncbi:CMRF35-like molecule 2 isoform X1 [Onychostoma macrolepis]|uniref:CMRF35-like molecule 2 isoform X1 n=1 Tax=Onychostoma macrolepis TaxID=369639 RepID=UPI00272DA526|nr:CMRF35-like molecule 2 isoform X1 [Onychostoma macrolepis]